MPASNSKLHPIPFVLALGSILVTGMIMSLGCDPVRTIRHHVTLAVVDSDGTPVPGVKVSIKESWESWQSWGSEGETAEQKAYSRQLWKSEFVPWYEAVTDENGEAVIRIEITALDHTRGSKPPAKRDFISNREHIVRLARSDGQEETRILMKPGETASGERYTIRVMEIETPVYVE